MEEGTAVETQAEEKVETASTEVEKTAEEIAAETAAKEEEEKPIYTKKDFKGLRKSYERETRQERDARIAAETELRILKEQKESAPAKEVVTDAKPVRPREADFESHEAYSAAMDTYEDERDSWKSKKTTRESEVSDAKKAKQAIVDAVSKQVETGIKEYKDFDDVVMNNKALITNGLMTTALAKRANGHDIIYYLGKHPEESVRLAKISDPIELASEIGEISATVKASKPVKKETKEEKKEITKAPAPAATVQGKSKVSTDSSLEGKSQADRMKLIAEAAAKKRLAARR